jgi:hypothetical protein
LSEDEDTSVVDVPTPKSAEFDVAKYWETYFPETTVVPTTSTTMPTPAASPSSTSETEAIPTPTPVASLHYPESKGDNEDSSWIPNWLKTIGKIEIVREAIAMGIKAKRRVFKGGTPPADVPPAADGGGGGGDGRRHDGGGETWDKKVVRYIKESALEDAFVTFTVVNGCGLILHVFGRNDVNRHEAEGGRKKRRIQRAARSPRLDMGHIRRFDVAAADDDVLHGYYFNLLNLMLKIQARRNIPQELNEMVQRAGVEITGREEAGRGEEAELIEPRIQEAAANLRLDIAAIREFNPNIANDAALQFNRRDLLNLMIRLQRNIPREFREGLQRVQLEIYRREELTEQEGREEEAGRREEIRRIAAGRLQRAAEGEGLELDVIYAAMRRVNFTEANEDELGAFRENFQRLVQHFVDLIQHLREGGNHHYGLEIEIARAAYGTLDAVLQKIIMEQIGRMTNEILLREINRVRGTFPMSPVERRYFDQLGGEKYKRQVKQRDGEDVRLVCLPLVGYP